MKYKCPGIIEDWCGDLPAGLGTPEPDTKCQIVTQSQLDRIEAKLDLLLEQKKPVKKRASKNTYSPHFEIAWANYPRRVGNNSKQKASAAYEKRRQEGVMADELNFATTAYCTFCDATVEDKKFVLMAATFFGCQRLYEQDWTVPDKTESMPKSNDDLVSWSANKGFRTPRAGESWSEYRQAVQQLYRNV